MIEDNTEFSRGWGGDGGRGSRKPQLNKNDLLLLQAEVAAPVQSQLPLTASPQPAEPGRLCVWTTLSDSQIRGSFMSIGFSFNTPAASLPGENYTK